MIYLSYPKHKEENIMHSFKKIISVLLLAAMLVSTLALLPFSVFAEEATAAPAATDKESVLPVKWNKGFVGSKTNNGNKNKISASTTAGYSYSDLIVIPKKGTKIYFTDDVSSVATFDVFVFSEWKKSGSSYVIDDVEGTNLFGTSSFNGMGSTKVSGGQAYEYITDKDNQVIRLCYHSKSHSSDVTVYQILTSDKSTKQQYADTNFTAKFESDGTVSGIRWFCGYASSATNTNGSAKETKPHSKDYLHSGYIEVPEAGTTVTFTTPSTHTPNNAFNGITVYEKKGEGYVYSDGLDGLNARIYKNSGGKHTYTFTTSKDNEVIRVCFKIGTDGNYWQPNAEVTATWKKSGATPTLGEKPTFSWPEEEVLSILTGAKMIGTEIETKWNNGYIGSQYHSSQAYKIASPNNVEYNYSDVITIPKKGSTLYFFDETYEDYKGGSYASTSVMVLSHWKPVGNNWVIDKTLPNLDGCQVKNIVINDDYRIYTYTTTEDNENVRLCLRQCPADDRLEDSIRPVYIVEPTKLEAKADKTGEFFDVSYKDADDTDSSFSVYLPEGYTEETQYTLVFDNSEDAAVADLLAKCKFTGIIVKCKETGDKLFRVLEDVMNVYPVCISDVLFVGGDELHTHLDKYENLRVAQALLYTGNGKIGLTQTEAKHLSTFGTTLEAATWLCDQSENYYDILEGLEFYAIGDSYFGGSKLGQHQTWVNLMGTKYGMQFINFGVGGNTVGTFSGISSNSPAMADRYGALPDGGDIYLVEGGRNDRGKGVPIGKNTDNTNTTFKGALNIIIKGLRKNNPDALIVLVTAWSYKGNEKPSNNDYADAMQELVDYLNDEHVICLYAADADWTGIEMANGTVRKLYCIAANDVSHLNVNGMNKVLPLFETWIAEQYAKFKGEELTNRKTNASFNPDLLNAVESTEPHVENTDSPEEKKGCGSSVAAIPTVMLCILGAALTVKKKEN